jgi:hypothetical protein
MVQNRAPGGAPELPPARLGQTQIICPRQGRGGKSLGTWQPGRPWVLETVT